MNGWSRWSIRRKLFSVILFILIVNIVVLLFMGSTLFEGFYMHNKVKELKKSAEQIQKAYRDSSSDFYDEISRMENENTLVTLFSIDEDDQLVYVYHSRAGKDNLRPWGDRPNMPKPRDDDGVNRFKEDMLKRLKEAEAEGYNVYFEGPIWKKDSEGSLSLISKLDDNLYLYQLTPRGYIKSTADLAVVYTGLLSIGILLVGAVIIYFVVGRVTGPIRDIQKVADQISRLDFTRRCEVKGGDEIALLGASINHMSDELQDAVEKLVDANEVLQSDLTRQQQTDQFRRQFVANVSHDFKTPLTLMISYAESLAEQERDPARVESCEVIISEGNRLSVMVGKLLELSRLESGVDQAEISMFCLSEVVDNAARNHRIVTERRDIHVQKRMEEEFIVCADYGKIEQVVANLFENAVKYSPDGGKITVTARRRDDKCRVEIENLGSRIVEDDLESLFDSFFRADKSRSREVQGYGLGLAIVKLVIEAHRELYGVENTGDGVRFWFELALADFTDDSQEEYEDSEI